MFQMSQKTECTIREMAKKHEGKDTGEGKALKDAVQSSKCPSSCKGLCTAACRSVCGALF